MGQQIQPKRPLTGPGVGLKDVKGVTKIERHEDSQHGLHAWVESTH